MSETIPIFIFEANGAQAKQNLEWFDRLWLFYLHLWLLLIWSKL